jgi:hypothetical protein
MLSRVPAGELMDIPRRAPVRRTAEVLYSDTSWRPCLIVAWVQYQGGWAALIRWPDGREDWRQFNRRHMRPGGYGDPGLRILAVVVGRRPHLVVGADPAGDPVVHLLARRRVVVGRVGQRLVGSAPRAPIVILGRRFIAGVGGAPGRDQVRLAGRDAQPIRGLLVAKTRVQQTLDLFPGGHGHLRPVSGVPVTYPRNRPG